MLSASNKLAGLQQSGSFYKHGSSCNRSVVSFTRRSSGIQRLPSKPLRGGLSPHERRTQNPTVVKAAGQAALTPEEYAESVQLKSASGALNTLSYISFWLQLGLTIVSSMILFFSIAATSQGAVADPAKWCTLVGVVLGLFSTFFAHGFNRLAKKLQADERVARNWLVDNLLRSNALNLFGIGATVVGLQASVGTLVGKSLMTNPQAMYGAPQGNAVLSLDIFALQALTNTLLAHFVAVVFTNIMLGLVNKKAKA